MKNFSKWWNEHWWHVIFLFVMVEFVLFAFIIVSVNTRSLGESDKIAEWVGYYVSVIAVAAVLVPAIFNWFFKPTWNIEVSLNNGDFSSVNFFANPMAYNLPTEIPVRIRNIGDIKTDNLSLIIEFADETKGILAIPLGSGRFIQRTNGVEANVPNGVSPSKTWHTLGTVKPSAQKESGNICWIASDGKKTQRGEIPYTMQTL